MRLAIVVAAVLLLPAIVAAGLIITGLGLWEMTVLVLCIAVVCTVALVRRSAWREKKMSEGAYGLERPKHREVR